MAAPEYGWGWIKWRVGRSLRNVGLVVVAGGAVATWAARRRLDQARLPEGGFLLELDLESQGVAEHVGPDGLQTLVAQGRKPLALRQVVGALREAGGDERVKGLVALLGAQSMGMAQIQELRGAVAEFK